MKRFLLFLTCLAGIIFTHGQVVIEFSKEKNKSRTFAKVQVKGTFPGGDTSWRSYLEKNLNASKVIGKGAKKGKYTVVVYYIVTKDGSIADIRCENDPGYDMCKEAVRLIKKTEYWGPSKVINRQVVKDTISNQ
jgi:periplasmic protein TonB